jgi:hypothetical protein
MLVWHESLKLPVAKDTAFFYIKIFPLLVITSQTRAHLVGVVNTGYETHDIKLNISVNLCRMFVRGVVVESALSFDFVGIFLMESWSD